MVNPVAMLVRYANNNPEKITYELALEAVKLHGGVLEKVPHSLKTEELCLEAVKNCCVAMKHVPGNLCTEEIGMFGIMQQAFVFDYIPEECKTHKLSLMAFKLGASITSMPRFAYCEELWLDLIKESGTAYRHSPFTGGEHERLHKLLYLV